MYIFILQKNNIFQKRGKFINTVNYSTGLNKLTFSGLLNAIDGIISPDSAEPQLLFLTTNYPERLDSALVRPGRIDFQAHLDYCDHRQVKMFYKRFYPSSSGTEEAENFAQKLFSEADDKDQTNGEDLKISAAQLQGHFMHYKFDGIKAAKNVGSLISVAGKTSCSA